MSSTNHSGSRSRRTRSAVLWAADDLVAEVGYRALTIEGIAVRAGVAKQTIYRQWPGKVEILLDALIEDAAEDLAVPGKEPSEQQVRDYFRRMGRFVSEDAGKIYLALMGEAQQDARVAILLRDRFLEPRRQQEREMVSKLLGSLDDVGQERLDDALDVVSGPILARAMRGRTVSREFVDRLVDLIL